MLEMSMTDHENPFRSLDDQLLLDAAKRLTTEERCATAALLRALMEIDTRRLYLGEGCASMFVWCKQVLHLAEGAAYNRIEAARAARDYPVILELFEQSAITRTAVRLLAPHLTDANHVSVLTSARHKSEAGDRGTRGSSEAETGRARDREEAAGGKKRRQRRCLLIANNAALRSYGTDAAAAASALRCTAASCGHGPTLFAGLSKRIDLRLVSRLEFGSGAVAMRYEPRR